MNTHEALDRAAVNHNFIVDRFFHLGSRDRHILKLTEDISELHADEFHVVFTYQANNVFLAVLAHDPILLKNKESKGTSHSTLALERAVS